MDSDQPNSSGNVEERLRDELQERLFVDNIIGDGKEKPSEPKLDQILSDIRFIRDRYGIRPTMHDLNSKDQPGVKAEQMDFKDAVEAVKIFREELTKYPPKMIRDSGINQFRIMKNLNINGGSPSEIILGVAFEPGEIYVANGDRSLSYRQTIHHEFWHRFDYQRYELKGKVPFLKWVDDIRDARIDLKWEGVCKKYGMSYTGNDWRSLPNTRPEGFINEYSTTSSKEDRASIAQLLMTQPGDLASLCQNDKLLAEKVRMLKKLYFKDSKSKMNKHYFKDLADGKVDEEYWDSNR
jgi:hypothetical protein